MRGTEKGKRRVSSGLAEEQEHTEESSALVLRFDAALAQFSPEQILRWTAETARESSGAAYAHAVWLEGHLHQTAVDGNRIAYPGWWHPEIQRLASSSYRAGRVQYGSNAVHGIKGLLAVPITTVAGRSLGAIVVGGSNPGSSRERCLKLIATPAAFALEKVERVSGRHTAGVTNRPPGRRAWMERAAQLLATSIDLRDPHLGEHSRGVSLLARHIGHAMSLGRDEHETIKQHTTLGARMLNSAPELAPAIATVKHHHERIEGNGYPERLRGEDIPLTARITFVADAFDCMAKDRPYRRKLSGRAAVAEIARHSGGQFDPEVVKALQEIVGGSEYHQITS
ncbi:MAG: HD-GYP domain-containing protein [Rubrobacteraceae bacterium]